MGRTESTTSPPRLSMPPGTARIWKGSAKRGSRCCCSRRAWTSGWWVPWPSATASNWGPRARGGLARGKLEDEAEKQQQEKPASDHKELTEKIKTSLAERVKEVRVTHRLTDSPACLVAGEHDSGGNTGRRA